MESLPFTRSETFLHTIAAAYSDAVLTGAKMQDATTAFEAIRQSADTGDEFKTWSVIDDRIGVVEDAALERVLTNLRGRFVSGLMDAELALLREAFEDDTRRGWACWLRTCARALSKRPEFCAKLSLVEFPFPPEEAEMVETVRRGARFVNEIRWDEAYDLHARLAAQLYVDLVDRVELYVTAAEIQLYFLYRQKPAEMLLKAAEELHAGVAAGQARVHAGWGEWHLERRATEEARRECAAAIQIDPGNPLPYLIMGDSYERENDIVSAGEWYHEGLKQSPGDFSVHLRFVQLYGRPDFEQPDRDALIAESIRRAVAVNPETEYWTYITVGNVYQTTKQYEPASSWFAKAIALDEAGLRGYIAAGYLALEQSDFEQARRLFQKAIEIAPTAFDGYWGMAYLHERSDHDDAAALTFYEQALERRPVWEGIVRARMGAVLRRMGKQLEAEEMLLRAIAADPENSADAIATLEEIALAAGDADEALRIFTAIRAAAGTSYEADYKNRIGNLRAASRDYAAAIDAYLEAIAANPSNPAFHSNLAVAYVELADNHADNVRKAVAALTKALALAPDHEEYKTRLGDLKFRLAMLPRVGDVALDLNFKGSIVQVRFSRDLTPYVTENDRSSLTQGIKELVEKMRTDVVARAGARIPSITFSDIEDESVPGGSYEFKIFDQLVGSGSVQVDGAPARFFSGNKQELDRLKIRAKPSVDPLTGAQGWWVGPDDWAHAESAQLPLWHVMQYPLRHFEAVCDRMLGGAGEG
jgi:tetratricopeptide (TPR) repeat protein